MSVAGDSHMGGDSSSYFSDGGNTEALSNDGNDGSTDLEDGENNESSIDRFFITAKKAVNGVLYTMSKHSSQKAASTVIYSVIDSVQMLSFVIPNKNLFNNDLPPILVSISEVVSFFELGYKMKESFGMQNLLICTLIIVSAILVLVFHVGKMFSSEEFTHITPIKMLRTFVPLLVGPLYIPLVGVLTKAFKCNEFSVLQGVACHVMQPVAVLISLLFILLCLIVCSCFYDPSQLSKSLNAKPHSRIALLTLTVKTTLVLLSVFVYDINPSKTKKIIWAFTNLVLSSLLCACYIYYQPLYNRFMVQLKSVSMSIFAWASLCLCVHTMVDQPQSIISAILLLGGVPLVFPLCLLCINERQHRLKNCNAKELDNAYDVELKTRLMLQECMTKSKREEADDETLIIAAKIYKQAVKRMESSSMICIFQAEFLFTFVAKNGVSLPARRALLTAVDRSPAFDVEFIIYKQKRNIAEAVGKTTDIVSYVQAEQYYRMGRLLDQQCCTNLLKFWAALREKEINISEIQELSSNIALLMGKAKVNYSKLLKLKPNDAEILKLYGTFLSEVISDSDKGRKLLVKASKIEAREIYGSKNQQQGNNSIDNFMLDSNGVLSIDCELGDILTCNPVAANHLGEMNTLLIGRSVKSMLVPPLSLCMEDILGNFLEYGDDTFFDKVFHTFVQSVDGSYISVDLMLKPYSIDGFNFSIFVCFKPIKTQRAQYVFDQHGVFLGCNHKSEQITSLREHNGVMLDQVFPNLSARLRARADEAEAVPEVQIAPQYRNPHAAEGQVLECHCVRQAFFSDIGATVVESKALSPFLQFTTTNISLREMNLKGDQVGGIGQEAEYFDEDLPDEAANSPLQPLPSIPRENRTSLTLTPLLERRSVKLHPQNEEGSNPGDNKSCRSDSSSSQAKHIRSRLQLEISKNGLHHTIKPLKDAYNLSMLLIMCIAIIVFAVVSVKFSSYTKFEDDIVASGRRRYFVSNILNSVYQLDLLHRDPGLLDVSETEVRDVIQHAATQLLDLENVIHDDRGYYDDEFAYMYSKPIIPMYELMDNQIIEVSRTLYDATTSFASTALTLAQMPLSQIDENLDMVFFIQNNIVSYSNRSPPSYYTYLNRSILLMVETTLDAVASLHAFKLVMFSVAFVIMTLAIGKYVLPRIVSIERNRLKTLNVLSQLPRNIIDEISITYRDRLRAVHSIHVVDSFSKQKKEKKAKNKYIAAVQRRVNSSSKKSSSSSKKKRVYPHNEEAIVSVEQEQEDNSITTQWYTNKNILFGTSKLLLILWLYLVYIYLYMSVNADTFGRVLSEGPMEANVASQRRALALLTTFYLTQLACQVTQGCVVDLSGAVVDSNATMVYLDRLSSAHNALIYGGQYGDNILTGILGRVDPDPRQMTLLFKDGCQTYFEVEENVNRRDFSIEECNEFNNGVMRHGLHHGIQLYIKLAKSFALQLQKAILKNETTSTFTDMYKLEILRKMEREYLSYQFQQSIFVYADALKNHVSTDEATKINLLIGFLVGCILSYIAIVLPYISKLNREVKNFRSLLMIFPIDAIETLDVLKKFLINEFQEYNKKKN